MPATTQQLPETGFLRIWQIIGNPKATPPTPLILNRANPRVRKAFSRLWWSTHRLNSLMISENRIKWLGKNRWAVTVAVENMGRIVLMIFGRLIFGAGNETVVWSLDDALISSEHARARKSLLSVLKSKPDNYAWLIPIENITMLGKTWIIQWDCKQQPVITEEYAIGSLIPRWVVVGAWRCCTWVVKSSPAVIVSNWPIRANVKR